MTEEKIMKLEKLLNELDDCIEDMSIYYDNHPDEFTLPVSVMMNQMEEERVALEELILSLDKD